MTVWTGTLPTIVVGAKILGSDVDTLSDALGGVADAWTSYTPTWSSLGTQPALGNGTLTGYYRQTGKWVEVQISLTMGSTTTYGTATYQFLLPVTAVRTNQIGSSALLDSGTADKAGSAYLIDTTHVVPLSSSGGVTATVPHTWATSDQIRIHISYEAA